MKVNCKKCTTRESCMLYSQSETSPDVCRFFIDDDSIKIKDITPVNLDTDKKLTFEHREAIRMIIMIDDLNTIKDDFDNGTPIQSEEFKKALSIIKTLV